jgi:hypothetical protein
VRLNFVFFTDSVSELYGQRMYRRKILNDSIMPSHCRSTVLCKEIWYGSGEQQTTTNTSGTLCASAYCMSALCTSSSIANRKQRYGNWERTRRYKQSYSQSLLLSDSARVVGSFQ